MPQDLLECRDIYTPGLARCWSPSRSFFGTCERDMSGCVRRTDSLLVLEKTGDEELNTLLWSAGGSCVRTSYMRACAYLRVDTGVLAAEGSGSGFASAQRVELGPKLLSRRSHSCE